MYGFSIGQRFYLTRDGTRVCIVRVSDIFNKRVTFEGEPVGSFIAGIRKVRFPRCEACIPAGYDAIFSYAAFAQKEKKKMPFKTMSELRSRTNLAYSGTLKRREILIPDKDWQALIKIAKENDTAPSEIIRVLIRGLIEGGRSETTR